MIRKNHISKKSSVYSINTRQLSFPQRFVYTITRILFYTGYLPFRFRPFWCNTSQSFYWVVHKNSFQKLVCFAVHILISLYTVYDLLKSMGWVENDMFRQTSLLQIIYTTFESCSTVYFTCSIWFSESQWSTLLTSRQLVIIPYTLKEKVENLRAVLFPMSWVLSSVYLSVTSNQAFQRTEPWNLRNVALIPFRSLTILEFTSDILFLAIAINFRDASRPLLKLLSKELKTPCDVVLNEFKIFEKYVQDLNENCGVWIFLHSMGSICYNSLHLLQILKGHVHFGKAIGKIAFFGITFVFLMMVASTCSNVSYKTIYID